MQIPGKKESTKKNQKIKPKKRHKKCGKQYLKKDTKIRKIPSKNKVHISKDSPNAGTGGSLVLYSYKEKHERHRKNIIKECVKWKEKVKQKINSQKLRAKTMKRIFETLLKSRNLSSDKEINEIINSMGDKNDIN